MTTFTTRKTFEATGGSVDKLGYSVSSNFNGDIVAVGVPNRPVTGGAVNVYKKIETVSGTVSWSLVYTINGTTGGDKFGTSVALNAKGDRIVIGAPDTNSSQGQVKVYESDASGTSWSQIGSDIDGAASDSIGTTVSINGKGNRVALGAPNHNTFTGYVDIYEWNGSAWVQKGSRIDGLAPSDQFGSSVRLDYVGRRVVIGAPGRDSNTGNVYVFEYGADWSILGAPVAGASAGDFFGTSVSFNSEGWLFAAGGPSQNSDTGYAETYSTVGSVWTKRGQTITGSAAGDLMGVSISLNAVGNKMLVGSPGAKRAVYYEYREDTWTTPVDKKDAEVVLANSAVVFYGSSVHLDGLGYSALVGGNNDSFLTLAPGHAEFHSVREEPHIAKRTTVDAFDGTAPFPIIMPNAVSMNSEGDHICISSGIQNIGNAKVLQLENKLTSSNKWSDKGSVISNAPGVNAGQFDVINRLNASGNRVGIQKTGLNDMYAFFDFDGANWVEISGITSTVSPRNEMTFNHVGDRFAFVTSSGVFVHEWDGATWSQLGGTINSGPGVTTANTIMMDATGNRLIIGDSSHDSNRGVARVFEYNANTSSWIQIGADFDGEHPDALMGKDVNINAFGNRVAIASPNNSTALPPMGSSNGFVKVLDWNGSSWTQVGNTVNSPVQSTVFGRSASLSYDGTYLAVLSPIAFVPALVSKHISVYKLSPTGAAWRHVDADLNSAGGDAISEMVRMSGAGNVFMSARSGLTEVIHTFNTIEPTRTTWSPLGPDVSYQRFNTNNVVKVAMNGPGDRLAIAVAQHNPANAVAADAYFGYVAVFEYDGSAWSMLGSELKGLIKSDGFGGSISLSDTGDRLAVGAPHSNGSTGQTRMFEWDSASWAQIGNTVDGDALGDYAGVSVSLNAAGNRVAIGAALHSTGSANNAGQVKIFELAGSVWTQLGSDIVGNENNEFFGGSVSLNAAGDRVAAGASGAFSYVGGVDIYIWSGSAWSQIGTRIVGGTAGDRFGNSVSINSAGDTVVIGAPMVSYSNQSGYIEVHSHNGTAWEREGPALRGDASDQLGFYGVDISDDGSRIVARSNQGIKSYKRNGANYELVDTQVNQTNTTPGISGINVALNSTGKRIAYGFATSTGSRTGFSSARVHEIDVLEIPSLENINSTIIGPQSVLTTDTEITLSWNPAAQKSKVSSYLRYKGVYSSSNNVGTVADAEANGSVLFDYTRDFDFTLNQLSHTITFASSPIDVSVPQNVWFNIIVKNSDDIKTVYTQRYMSITKQYDVTALPSLTPTTPGDKTVRVDATITVVYPNVFNQTAFQNTFGHSIDPIYYANFEYTTHPSISNQLTISVYLNLRNPSIDPIARQAEFDDLTDYVKTSVTTAGITKIINIASVTPINLFINAITFGGFGGNQSAYSVIVIPSEEGQPPEVIEQQQPAVDSINNPQQIRFAIIAALAIVAVLALLIVVTKQVIASAPK